MQGVQGHSGYMPDRPQDVQPLVNEESAHFVDPNLNDGESVNRRGPRNAPSGAVHDRHGLPPLASTSTERKRPRGSMTRSDGTCRLPPFPTRMNYSSKYGEAMYCMSASPLPEAMDEYFDQMGEEARFRVEDIRTLYAYYFHAHRMNYRGLVHFESFADVTRTAIARADAAGARPLMPSSSHIPPSNSRTRARSSSRVASGSSVVQRSATE